MNFKVASLLLLQAYFIAAYSPFPATKRQSGSYSSTIYHEDGQHPYKAQSAVDVSFNAQESQKTYTSAFQPAYQAKQNHFPANDGTQLFNVGYSVRFKNPPTAPTRPRKPNLDEGEIITGTRKRNEQVIAPKNFAALDEKQHKISGIKAKPKPIEDSYKTPDPILSPITQKFLKSLEETQPLFKSPQEARQIHKENYEWRNLSPSVQIIRSTEIPSFHFGSESNNPSFNHASALGKSQSFDFTNAIEGDAQYQKAGSESSINSVEEFLPPITKQLPNQLVQTSQLPQVNLNQNQNHQAEYPMHKFDPYFIDTRLMREPVITTDPQNIPKNPNIVPIHFDIRPIQDVMKSQLTLQSPQTPYKYNLLQENQQEGHKNRYTQPYFDIGTDRLRNQEIIYKNKVPYKMYGKPQVLKPNKPMYAQRQPRGRSEKMHNMRPPPRYQRRRYAPAPVGPAGYMY